MLEPPTWPGHIADHARREEHVFDTGLDHGLLYEPRPDRVDRVVFAA